MKKIFLFFSWYFLLDVNLIGADFLVCRAKNSLDEPTHGYKINYCDGETQQCCDTGCCPKNKRFLLMFLVLGSGFFICCLYNCIKCCRSTDFATNSGQSRISRFSRRFRSRRLVEPPAQVGASELPMSPARNIPRENGTQTLTPPPAYDMAVFASSAPPAAADRVPSYAEVMEAQKGKQ